MNAVQNSHPEQLIGVLSSGLFSTGLAKIPEYVTLPAHPASLHLPQTRQNEPKQRAYSLFSYSQDRKLPSYKGTGSFVNVLQY